MKYGVDVAVSRADDLDKLMLKELDGLDTSEGFIDVLDIGSGAGGQSARLAELGALVTAVDILDYSTEFSALESKLKTGNRSGRVLFVQADIVDWIKNTNDKFHLVSCQRVLHYLPYKNAKQLLVNLRKCTTGKLFLSVTGATSAIADGYDKLSSSIEERFGVLSPLVQEKFSITAPLCIYHEYELLSLLEATGWEITWSRVSDFGNIKIVAVPAKG